MANEPTKTVEYFVDLMPGWQLEYGKSDGRGGTVKPHLFNDINTPWDWKPTGAVRVRVLIELPCVGDYKPDADVAATTIKMQD